ncbi:hypothetical protein EV200_10117 [Pedobacter psychrotolerans]|uniref:Uncharacterized protein n=1 Tax=Pedobacter psychrotolerans TaxID=1843235 RepID=A0A4V6NN51_9SPHI|nr:hypothetical protein [Pedobacter psychrotolerans]TCO30586.1 hypothetical protein EV200_10117 [Pedobacter psychrotolerans]GGE69053.1 hypothetical protein GCM10011413_39670 [Pedobacter psychrotolerans]
MKNRIIIITLISFLLEVRGYAQHRKKHFPAATFHQANAKITGISYGIASGLKEKHANVLTNGMRLELIGLGLILPLAPSSPINEGDDLVQVRGLKFTEKINGLNLSGSGTVCGDCIVNGITVGAIGQYLFAANGISISIVDNVVEKQNGLQFSMFNDVYKGSGLQIGIGNSAVDYKGLQVGVLSNVTSKCRGLQVGLFNKSKLLKGLQLGALEY